MATGNSSLTSIDYIVYQQLLTPNGRKCVDPAGSGRESAIAADSGISMRRRRWPRMIIDNA